MLLPVHKAVPAASPPPLEKSLQFVAMAASSAASAPAVVAAHDAAPQDAYARTLRPPPQKPQHRVSGPRPSLRSTGMQSHVPSRSPAPASPPAAPTTPGPRAF